MNAESSVAAILENADPPRIAVNFAPILRALTVKGIGLMDVVRVIDSHALIVARLISLANSAWSNPVKPITAVQQACTRLGLDVVRSVSIALCVCRSFNLGRCGNFDPLLHWLASLLAAEICAKLAEDRNEDVGAARTAGLMHNIGILWLADRFPDETNQALGNWNPAHAHSLDQVMIDNIGIGYLEAGRILVDKMGLPATLRAPLTDAAHRAANHQPAGMIQTAAGIASCVLHEERDISDIVATSILPASEILELFTQCSAQQDRYRHLAAMVATA